jgi:hypothetical protein
MPRWYAQRSAHRGVRQTALTLGAARTREQHTAGALCAVLDRRELHRRSTCRSVAEDASDDSSSEELMAFVRTATDRSAALTVLQDEDQEEDSSDDSSSAKHIGTSSRVHHVRLTTVTRSNPAKSKSKSKSKSTSKSKFNARVQF